MKCTTKVQSVLVATAAATWILAATGTALADDDGRDDDDPNLPAERPEWVELRSFSYAGTGCPANSVTANVPVEGTTFVIGWEPFTAAAGPDVPFREQRKNCQLNIDLGYTEGWQYAVKSLDYGGTVSATEGARAEVGSLHYFQGSDDTARFATELAGPLDAQAFSVNDVVDEETLKWSTCDATRSLNLNVTARVTASGDAEAAVRFGENADGPVASVLNLVWRRCE